MCDFRVLRHAGQERGQERVTRPAEHHPVGNRRQRRDEARQDQRLSSSETAM